MDKEISSEEKLLKLIRNKDAGISGKNAKAQENKENSTASSGASKKKVNIKTLKKLNKFLLMLCIVAGIFVLASYFLPDRDYEQVSRSKKLKDNSDVGVYSSEEEKPFGYYKSVLESRDVFKLPWENDQTVSDEIVESSDLAKKFRIVGIMLDESPLVAIEDVAIRQTFFLSEGDEVSGITINKILEDKIIVSYNGELVELAP